MAPMKTALTAARLILRELVALIRDMPRLLAERLDAYLERERKHDTLRIITGDRGLYLAYLHAVDGDIDAAIDIASVGLDIEMAIDLAAQGAEPDHLRYLADLWATTPPDH
jgi:hypothetical protein